MRTPIGLRGPGGCFGENRCGLPPGAAQRLSEAGRLKETDHQHGDHRPMNTDKQAQALHGNPWKGKTVLLVDDYPTIRKTLRELVHGLGLECREAENGLQAQEKLKEALPDLVITDLVMPEMDGFELTEAIKASPDWRRVPVVIISTHADSRYIFKALRLGADDYLTKPATRDMLITILDRVFDNEW